MKSLNEIKWEAFPIEDIFDIESGRDIYDKERLVGKTPYLTATANQNGIGYFVGNTNETLDKDCLSVNRNGSVGYAFYHPYKALFGNDTRKLKPKVKCHYACFFLAKMITVQKDKFGYGLKLGTERLKKQKIMLPINEACEPDYEFMEEYMKAIEKKLLERYHKYLNKTNRISLIINNIGGGNIKWKDYDIQSIFPEIKRGKRLKNEDHIFGEMPYVSSSGLNNGVDDFVNNKEGVRIFEECLSLANSGSVGSTFYHPYKYVASDHVTKLKNKEYNKYIYLYLATITSRLSEKYSYNREINEGRLNREKMIVPINKSGLPDYKYMESYMRAKEIEIINRYITKRLSNL